MAYPRHHKLIGTISAEWALSRKIKLTGQYRQIKPVKEPHLFIPNSLIDKIEQRAQVKGRVPTSHEASAKKVLRVFEILESQRHRSVTHRELIAALAFEYGLDSKHLLSYANAVNNAAKFLKKGGNSNISTTGINLLHSIKYNTPTRVLEKMQSEKIFTTHSLAEILGMTRIKINEALLLLEQMGLATKLPQETDKPGGQSYRWIITNKRFLSNTLPQKNVAFKIFMSLYEGSKGAIAFISNTPLRGTKKNALSNATTVRKALNLLISTGLVTRSKKAQIVTYALTQEGKTIAKQQQKSKFLIPKLRVALLGESKRFRTGIEKLPLHQRRKLNLIRSYIEIKLAFQERQKQGFGYGDKKRFMEELSKSTGRTINFVADAIRTTKWTPWRNLLEKTITGVYLPLLDKQNVKAGQWLRERLRKERGILIEPPIGSTRIVSINAASKEFLERNNIKPTQFNRAIRLTQQHFDSKPREYTALSNYLTRYGNMPYNQANLITQFIIYRWEELILK